MLPNGRAVSRRRGKTCKLRAHIREVAGVVGSQLDRCDAADRTNVANRGMILMRGQPLDMNLLNRRDSLEYRLVLKYSQARDGRRRSERIPV